MITTNSLFNIEAITNILEQKCTAGLGLIGGRMGLALFYFTLPPEYHQRGYELLDHISDHITEVDNASFSNGLAGIGWGIEWTVQKEFLSANTDDILQDLDDELYKKLVYAYATHISLSDGSLSQGMYFTSRLKSRNFKTHRFNQVVHQESIFLIVEEIAEALSTESGKLEALLEPGNAAGYNTLIDIAQSLLFFSNLSSVNLKYVLINETIYYIIGFIEKFFETAFKYLSDPRAYAACVYLAYAQYYTGDRYNFDIWKKRALLHFDQIIGNVNFSITDLMEDSGYLCAAYTFSLYGWAVASERKDAAALLDTLVQDAADDESIHADLLLQSVIYQMLQCVDPLNCKAFSSDILLMR